MCKLCKYEASEIERIREKRDMLNEYISKLKRGIKDRGHQSVRAEYFRQRYIDKCYAKKERKRLLSQRSAER